MLLRRYSLMDNRDDNSGGDHAHHSIDECNSRFPPFGRERGLRNLRCRDGNMDHLHPEVCHPQCAIPLGFASPVWQPTSMAVCMAVFVSLNVGLYPQCLQSLQQLLPTIRGDQREGRHLEINVCEPEQCRAVCLMEGIYVLWHPLFAQPVTDFLC